MLVSAGQSFAIARDAAPQAVRVCLGPPPTREALARALAVVSEVRARPPMPHASVVSDPGAVGAGSASAAFTGLPIHHVMPFASITPALRCPYGMSSGARSEVAPAPSARA